MKELKVNSVIIGKQFDIGENYKMFVNIAKEKNIKVYAVEAGDRIDIDSNLYFNVLWPDSNNIISENGLNNNSLVFKLVNKNISILFTGDIQEIAEKEIIKKYSSNLEVLYSTVLKVAHHGSNTSSTKEFLNVVNPKYALIGVGLNNKFDHPSDEVIERLNYINCKIYRTDQCGEITIEEDGLLKKGTFRITMHKK